jgi:ketosteroid isomerase-like protein
MMRLLLLTILSVALSVPGCFAQGTGAAAPAPAVQDTSAQQTIRQLERARRDAMLRGDAQALSRLLGDDYIGTGAHGKVRSKAEVVAEYNSGRVKYESITEDGVVVRQYGSAAVVTGRTTSKGKEGGKAFDSEHRFTRVWIQAPGRWSLVAAHSSPITAR